MVADPCQVDRSDMALDPIDPFIVSARGGRSLSRMQARHARFALTSRGVRMTAADVDTDQARWLAAQLPLRPEVVLSHSTAAQIHGLPLPYRLQRILPAHVSAPRDVHRPRRRDLISHSTDLAEDDVMTVDDLRVTTPARTYVDLAALLELSDLVAVGDVLLRDHGLTRARLDTQARVRDAYAGRILALRAVDWLDGAAASPRESHLRVLLREAGLPRPEVNGTITDDQGGFLAIGDLVFRVERVIVEYDGVAHAPVEQRAKDASRRAVLREHGWIVVEIVGEDMLYPDRVIRRVTAALADGRTRRR